MEEYSRSKETCMNKVTMYLLIFITHEHIK